MSTRLVVCLLLSCLVTRATAQEREPARNRPSGIASRTADHWDEATVGFKHISQRDAEGRRGLIDVGRYLAASVTFKPSFLSDTKMVFKALAIRVGGSQAGGGVL